MRSLFRARFVGSALTLFLLTQPVAAQESAGALLYQQKCARCHGKSGEGTKEHPNALIGNRSLAQLTKYVAKYMPEDAPRTLSEKDSAAVSAYIFDAFYSPAAQARIKAPRVELARLTVNEYRQTIADLVGTFKSFGKMVPSIKGTKESTGLRGEYFTGAGGKKGGRTQAFARIDPVVNFDFLKSTPDFDKLNTPEIAANWQGSVVALDTGMYEFIVRTEHSTRLWVNDMRKPLIDKAVKSGNDTEFRGSLYLLAGRAYPVRLEFSRGNVGVRKDPKDKLKTEKTTMELAWRPPLGAVETIPQRQLRPTDAGTSFALSISMPPDDRSAGYERGSAVSKEWVQATTDGAIETAVYVAANLADLSGIKSDATNRAAQLQEFCVKFAERAFRGPLSPEQKKLYIERQFEVAKDADTAVKRVVLLVLQSPRFLYREPAAVSPAAIKGDDPFDVAARMSFSLWDSLPDEALLKAAAGGQLKTRSDVVREAERMLADPRAKAKLRGFFLQWLKADQAAEVAKDPKHYPGFDASVVSDLRTSLELMVDDVLWSKDADYRRLITMEQLHLNGRLAKFYGAELPANAPFQKVAMKTGERAGVLTHPFLLAQLSYTASSSPIHRGVFLARNILGVTLRQPPDAFTPLPAELHPKLSTRERIELQTSPKDCKSCHGIINPLGFTLENFDAIGRFRDLDNQKPINAAGSFVTRSGDTVSFKNAQELARFVRTSDEAHEAFVARVFHHLVRQPILAYGPDKLNELRRDFAENECNMQRLVIEVIAQSALPAKGKSGEKK